MGARGPKPLELCKSGHPMTGDNVEITTRTTKSGTYRERRCRECRRAAARKWWRENRGKKTA